MSDQKKEKECQHEINWSDIFKMDMAIKFSLDPQSKLTVKCKKCGQLITVGRSF